MRDDHDKVSISTSPKKKKRKEIGDQCGADDLSGGALTGREQQLKGEQELVGPSSQVVDPVGGGQGLAGGGQGLVEILAQMRDQAVGGLTGEGVQGLAGRGQEQVETLAQMRGPAAGGLTGEGGQDLAGVRQFQAETLAQMGGPAAVSLTGGDGQGQAGYLSQIPGPAAEGLRGDIGLSDGGQGLAEDQEMFLADESRWENMGAAIHTSTEKQEETPEKEFNSGKKENISKIDDTPQECKGNERKKNVLVEVSDLKGINLKETFEKEGLKQENFGICRVTSDGRCGAHCIALHVYNDEAKEKEVMKELNAYIVEEWNTYKNHFSFPCSHPIGIGRENVIFESEKDLKLFLETKPDAVHLWVDHPWLQAAAALYQTKIHILTTGVEIPRWTIVQPKAPKLNPDKVTKSGDMYLLHANNLHFDLLIVKNKPTEEAPITLEEQKCIEKDLRKMEEEKGNNEIHMLRLELADSKKQIKDLQDLVIKLLPQENQVQNHEQRSSINELPKSNICSDCGKHFNTFLNLEAHVTKDHCRNEIFNCTTCNKTYSTKENLWIHISEEHTKKFNCDSCEETFTNERALTTHDLTKHTTDYNCEECDYQNIYLNHH